MACSMSSIGNLEAAASNFQARGSQSRRIQIGKVCSKSFVQFVQRFLAPIKLSWDDGVEESRAVGMPSIDGPKTAILR